MIIVLLLLLIIIKGINLSYRINFESPLMEYTAYLCEPLSWISILTIFYMRFYSSNISIMLWIYSGFVFIYLYR